jgi:hypothetical protein
MALPVNCEAASGDHARSTSVKWHRQLRLKHYRAANHFSLVLSARRNPMARGCSSCRARFSLQSPTVCYRTDDPPGGRRGTEREGTLRKVTLAAVLLLGFTTAAAATTCKQRADNCERNQGGPGCHDAARMAACAKNKLYIAPSGRSWEADGTPAQSTGGVCPAGTCAQDGTNLARDVKNCSAANCRKR